MEMEMLKLIFFDKMYHEAEKTLTCGGANEVVNFVEKNESYGILLPFYKLRDNKNLSCKDIFMLCEKFKVFNSLKIKEEFIEFIDEIHISDYLRDIDSNSNLILRYSRNMLLNEINDLNIDLIDQFIMKSNITSSDIIKYISMNKYMTCEIFTKLYETFPYLDYTNMEYILSKNISLEFINKIRLHLYTNVNLTALCENPKLAPEMLFDPKHEKYFKLADKDSEFSNIIALQTWSKKILHHITPDIDGLKDMPNINYFIFDFGMREDLQLDFPCPYYDLYTKHELYLTRDNFHYTTDVNVRKFIILRLHTRRFPIQIDILLIILTLSLY